MMYLSWHGFSLRVRCFVHALWLHDGVCYIRRQLICFKLELSKEPLSVITNLGRYACLHNVDDDFCCLDSCGIV